jgi:hypothetical protein
MYSSNTAAARRIVPRSTARRQRRRLEHPLEVGRPDANERRVEVRFQDLVPGEDPDLRALGRVGRREAHAAAAEEHDRRRPPRRRGVEQVSRRQVDGEIRRAHGQPPHVELPRAVEREPEQARRRRQPGDRAYLPWLRGRAADQFHLPRGHAPLDAALHEDFPQHGEPAVLARLAIAFLDNDAADRRPREAGRELPERVLVGAGRRGVHDRRAIDGERRRLHPRGERQRGVLGGSRLPGRRDEQREGQNQEHGASFN